MKPEVTLSGKENRLSVSFGEILYYLFWSFMLAAKGLGLYEGMRSYNLILVFSFSCILLKLLLEKHTWEELLLKGGLLLLGGLIYLNTGDKAPLINIMVIIGLKNVPVKRVFGLGLAVWSVSFGWRAFSEVTGIRTGLALVHDKLGLGPVLRWSFGLTHPNVLQISYAVLAAFILYVTQRKGKRLLALTGLLFLGNCYVFLYSVSYTGIILVTLFLLIFCYFMMRRQFSRVEKVLMQCVFPCCILISIVAPYMIDTSGIIRAIGQLLNKAVNNRFLASSVYLSYGIAPFGKNLVSENISFALDSSYISLLVNDGWVIFFLTVAAYFCTIRDYVRQDKRKELAIMLSFLIAGISEPFLFNSAFKNLSLVFIGEYLFRMFARRESREYGFGIALKRENVKIPFARAKQWLEKAKRCLNAGNRKRGIICLSIIVGIAVGILYWTLAPEPDAVYIAVGNTDCGKREEIYLDITELPKNFSGRILEYQGPDQPMYKFTGNIIVLEHFRGTVSWGLIGGAICGITCCGVACGIKRRSRMCK